MADQDFADWLTKQEAADALHVSTKQIERLKGAGKLQQEFRRQAGSPNVAVFNPEDVARLAAAIPRPGATPFVLSADARAPETNGNGHQLAWPDAPTTNVALRTGLDPVTAIFEGLNRLYQTSQTASIGMSQTLWLTLDEASAFTGLSVYQLRKEIDATPAIARRDHWRDAAGKRHKGWKLRRRDLEAL